MEIIFGAIFVMYIIIEALVPKITSWTESLSSVGGSDWGWVVFLLFLAVMYGVLKMIMGAKK